MSTATVWTTIISPRARSRRLRRRTRNIAIRVNQDGVGLYAEANAVAGYDLVYKTGAGDRYWYPDGRQYLYPIPAKVIRDYKNAGYTISQNPYWDNE